MHVRESGLRRNEAWGHKDRTDSEGRLLGQFVYEKVRTTRTSVLATTAAYC